MEKWIQKLSGALIASVLALTLSARASADLQSEDADPDQPLPQYEEEAPEDKGPDAIDTGRGSGDDDEEEEDETTFRDTDTDEGEGDGGGEVDDTVLTSGTDILEGNDPDNGNAGDAGTEEPGTISLGDTEFTPGESGSIDLSGTTADEDDLFGFDAGDPDDASDDCFYMVDYDGSNESLTSEGSDINIVAAGLNQLGSIIADGNVNLTGTGILLVDEIQLSEGCGFFLHPIEGLYESGSVAVFLLTSPADTANGTNAVYTMINGDLVPGILDESYTIPEGVTLVVPNGCSLILQSLVHETVTAHDNVPASVTTYTTQPQYNYDDNSGIADSEDPYRSYAYSAAQLTVPESSGIIVQSGANISFITLSGRYGGQNILPSLTVNGSFDNSGTVYGGTLGGIVFFGETSHVSGSGVYKDCRLYLNQHDSQDLSLNIIGTVDEYSHFFACVYLGCDVNLDHAATADDRPVDLGGLSVTGACKLIVAANSSVSSIYLSDGARLELYGHSTYEEGCPITLKSGITGNGSVLFKSGNYYITNNDFVLGDAVSVSAIGTHGNDPDPYAVTISDISGKLSSRISVTDACIRVDPDSVELPPPYVEVFPVFISNYYDFWDDSITWESESVDYSILSLAAQGLVTDGKVYLSRLQNYYSNYLTSESNGADLFVEVYSISNGMLTRYVISASDQYGAGDYISADEIWQIRLVTERSHSEAGGTSVMSTDTSMTGSGILGGSGAGSITGGAGSSIFTGTGISNDSGNDNGGNNGGNTGGGNDDDNGGGNDPAPIVNPQQDAQQDVVVTVTPQDPSGQQADSLEDLESVYTLSAAADGQIITDLNGSVTVRFSCPAPKTSGMIFAVFRDSDGSLKVFRARYDRISGQLVFQTDMLGEFAVVCIDYSGELYSEEFYDYLETFTSVQKLS